MLIERRKPYNQLDCLNILVKGLTNDNQMNKISFKYNSDQKIKTITSYTKDTQNNFLPLTYDIFLYENANFANILSFDVEGFIHVTDINTDFQLQGGMYYEVVDFDGNAYSVFVDSNLVIPPSSVIHDVAGFVRLQGVKMPCMVAIRNFSTLEKNTENTSLLELQSNFDNAGSPVATKLLLNNVHFYGN